MSKVIIKKMSIHYFKGIKSLEVDFKENISNIAGPNGSGKSTIADAFTWCLFGKNMKGESDTKFLIKTVDKDGVEIPHVNHEVIITLDVDGNNEVLKRVLVQDYDKDDNLKGNHTEYFWNDVPCKKCEYDVKVKHIIDEEIFKLITSPFAFLSLDWKVQRDMLMKMAGDINDIEIASKREDFTLLLANLSGKSIEDYKKEIAFKISRLKEEMSSIPARIDEVKRGMPDMSGYGVAVEDIKKKNDELKKIAEAEANEAEAAKVEIESYSSKIAHIQELKKKQIDILSEAERKERMAIHSANGVYNEAEQKLKSLQAEEMADSQKCESWTSSLRSANKTHSDIVDRLSSQRTELREKWMKVNAEEFVADEHLKCPLFGHGCQDMDACNKYESEQGAAYAAFASDKAQRLKEITEQGKKTAAQIESENLLISNNLKQIEEMKSGYEERSKSRVGQVEELERLMKENPKRPLIASVKGEDIPEWIDLGLQIAAEEQNLDEAKVTKNEELQVRKMAILDEIKELNAIVARKELMESSEKRIGELETSLSRLGAELASLESNKMVAEEFEIAKMDEVGKRVNSLFSIVKWQMFTRQVNGENVPACIALVDGVRWTDANTASKINAGIDIASTLARVYGVSAPMFIDNAECSGNILNTEGQQILLRFDNKSSKIELF